jgi:hypothetical protein
VRKTTPEYPEAGCVAGGRAKGLHGYWQAWDAGGLRCRGGACADLCVCVMFSLRDVCFETTTPTKKVNLPCGVCFV